MGCGSSTEGDERRADQHHAPKPPLHGGRSNHQHNGGALAGGGGSITGSVGHRSNSSTGSRHDPRERQMALDRLIAQLMLQDEIQNQQNQQNQADQTLSLEEIERKNSTRGLSDDELALVGVLGRVALKNKAVNLHQQQQQQSTHNSGNGNSNLNVNADLLSANSLLSSPTSSHGGHQHVRTRSNPTSCPQSPVFSLNTSMEGCVMCFEPFIEGSDEVRLLPCGHLFHSSCVDEWLKRRRLCPTCNQDVLPPVTSDGGLDANTTTAGGPDELDVTTEGEVGQLRQLRQGGDEEEDDDDAPLGRNNGGNMDHTSQVNSYAGSNVWTVVPYTGTSAATENESILDGNTTPPLDEEEDRIGATEETTAIPLVHNTEENTTTTTAVQPSINTVENDDAEEKGAGAITLHHAEAATPPALSPLVGTTTTATTTTEAIPTAGPATFAPTEGDTTTTTSEKAEGGGGQDEEEEEEPAMAEGVHDTIPVLQSSVDTEVIPTTGRDVRGDRLEHGTPTPTTERYPESPGSHTCSRPTTMTAVDLVVVGEPPTESNGEDAQRNRLNNTDSAGVDPTEEVAREEDEMIAEPSSLLSQRHNTESEIKPVGDDSREPRGEGDVE